MLGSLLIQDLAYFCAIRIKSDFFFNMCWKVVVALRQI